eukprot:5871526-Pyramimonas_sp.AAC.1
MRGQGAISEVGQYGGKKGKYDAHMAKIQCTYGKTNSAKLYGKKSSFTMLANLGLITCERRESSRGSIQQGALVKYL